MGKLKTQILLLCASLLFMCNCFVFAQTGGSSTYSFLNLPSSARLSVFGGSLLSINDGDINLAAYNPALIDSTLHGQISLGYFDHFVDINGGFAAYAHHLKQYGTFLGSLQYLDYGKFIEADEFGNEIGHFAAIEYAYSLGWAYPLDTNFSFGASLKGIHSELYTYRSFGMAADLAFSYHNRKRKLSISLLGRNIGTQIKPYTEGNKEKLPFDVQLGFSKKLAKAPLRIIGTYTHLQQFDLRHPSEIDDKPKVDLMTGDTLKEKKLGVFADKFARHLLAGVEFSPSDNFYVSLGYQYRRRQELKMEKRPSTVGFAWGFGFRVYRFHLSYARARYHLGGSTNFITLSTRINDFIKVAQ